jgi:hypothetical protein
MFKFFPGALDRDHADAQFLCHGSDRRQAGVAGQFALDDLCADLFKDLLIDWVSRGVRNNDFHRL